MRGDSEIVSCGRLLQQSEIIQQLITAGMLVMLAGISYEDLRTRRVPGRKIAAVFVWVMAGHLAGDIWPVSLREGAAACAVTITAAAALSLAVYAVFGRFPFGGSDLKILAAGALALGGGRSAAGFCAASAMAAGFIVMTAAVGLLRGTAGMSDKLLSDSSGTKVPGIKAPGTKAPGIKVPGEKRKSRQKSILPAEIPFVPFLSLGLAAAYLFCP